MKTKIKIVIADDHPIIRKGLVDIIEQETDIEILGQAANGEEAINIIIKTLPDIAIVDVNMPIKSGFDVAREIAKSKTRVQIIFLTMHDEQEMFKHALELNVSGYIMKDCAAEDIIDCIRAVHNDDFYFSPSLSKNFIANHKERFNFIVKGGIEKLTPTEKTILRLIAAGLTSSEIAYQLFVSRKTIENHRANICAKLDLHGVNALMKYAIQNQSKI